MYNFLPNKFNTDAIKNVPFFTACPASTKEEEIINDRLSITKNSLFLRKFYASEGNITLNICDKPVEPAILYSSESQMYEIGYEVGIAWLCCSVVDIFINSRIKNIQMGFLQFYYEQDKFHWEDGSNQRHNYRSVSTRRNYAPIHYEAIFMVI